MVSDGAWVHTNRSRASKVAGTISIWVSYSNREDLPVKILTTAAPQMIRCLYLVVCDDENLGEYKSNQMHNTLFVIFESVSMSDGRNVPGE